MTKHKALTIAIIAWGIVAAVLFWAIEGRGMEKTSGSVPLTADLSPMLQTLREDVRTYSSDNIFRLHTPYNVMQITPDGHIFFNEVPIEKMNVPEIREVMVKILEEIRAQSMIPHMGRQTDYLLEELEKYRKSKPAVD